MKTVFLLFDSLNRLMLEPYGSTLFETPNFKRLAKKSITFDKHYIGLEIPKHRSIDIDNQEDWKLAEILYR